MRASVVRPRRTTATAQRSRRIRQLRLGAREVNGRCCPDRPALFVGPLAPGAPVAGYPPSGITRVCVATLRAMLSATATGFRGPLRPLARDRLGKGSFPLTARERRALGGPGRSALGIAGPLCPSRPSARVLAVFGR